jgi:Cdc6-like AAA superfamily ATPase
MNSSANEIIRRKLIDPPSELFEGAREAQTAVEGLLRQSLAGESVSALLIGPSGCGKSAAVAAALAGLQDKIIAVELNGNFCSDDRACMREIFWQLVKKMRREDDGELRNITQTGTLSLWIEKLTRLLKESTRAGFLVFICLDKFEAFCNCKSKQGLLYNLYDLMHHPELKFVCLGVANTLAATDHLEKRIKSRFQLRRILVRNPVTVEEVISIVTRSLRTGEANLDRQIASILRGLDKDWAAYFNLGYSVRDFLTACIRAIVRFESEGSLKEAVSKAMHVFETSISTESATAQSMRDLNFADHLVLLSLTRLYNKVS